MANDNVINWELRIDGAQQASQNLGTVGTSFDDLDAKTRQATTRFTGVASAGSALGTSLSRLNPQLGTLVSAFGSAGGAASGLTTAIGGVGGLLGGGLVAAVAVAIQYFSNAQIASDNLTKSLHDQLVSVEELVKGYREMETLAAAASRKAFGVETVADLQQRKAETQALYNAAKAALDDQNRRRKEGLQHSVDSIATLQHEIILHERMIGKIDEQIRATKQLNNELDIEEVTLASVAKRSGKISEDFRVTTSMVEARQQEWIERMVADREASDRQYLDSWYEIEVLKGQARMEHERTIQEKITKIQKDELQKRERAEERANAMYASMGQRYVDVTASTMAQGLNALAQGKELAIGQIISAIGSELVAAGTRDVLQAAAFFFNPYMMAFAPGLLAAGGAEIAVGMGMGAAGSAATPSTGGSIAHAAATPANPTPRNLEEERNRESGPIVINVHTLRADEDAGKAIHESLRNYQKRHGRAASLERFV